MSDTEIPFTVDFTTEKGDLYVGLPKNKDGTPNTQDVASSVYLNERDFHALLDQ